MFGSFSRNIPSQALMRQANLDIDPRRYNWIGGTALPGRVCAAWHTAKVRTPADLLTTELIVGGGGSGSSLSILPTVFNHVLGTKFRLVEGYKGTNDTVIAMERGEVEGVCATYGTIPRARARAQGGQAAAASCAPRNRRSRRSRTCRRSTTSPRPRSSAS